MRHLPVVVPLLILLLFGGGTAAAGGPLGPPQPAAKSAGGLYTAVGAWHQENRYGDGGEYLFRQNQVYSEAGYGANDRWAVYGRLGVGNLNVREAFSPAASSVATDKSDFEDKQQLFGTLGGKVFYPLDAMFGIGAFLQGSAYFSDFRDQVSGSRSGAPFALELRVKDLREATLGFAVQANISQGVRLYGGPFLSYSEAVLSSSADASGLRFAGGDETVRNRTPLGGFAGIEAKLAKGFLLNIEGQVAERLSAGVAVLYVY